MRTSFVRAVLALSLLASLLFGLTVSAQDQSGTGISCDSTTTLLVLLAQRDMGYQPTIDTAGFNFGQFQSSFDMMQGSMMEATQEVDMAAMEVTQESTMMEATQEMAMGSNVLMPGMAEGEDPACTILRADVEAFLTSQMMTEGTMMQGGTMEATQEAGMAGVTCDSTTVLLTLLAQRDYSYQPMMDTTGFNFGQFQSSFDMMAQGGMMEATQEAGMMEATQEAGMMDSGMMLSPLSVAGEDPACAQLRADVESYLGTNMMMGSMQ